MLTQTMLTYATTCISVSAIVRPHLSPIFEDGLWLAFISFSRQVDIDMYGAFKKAFV